MGNCLDICGKGKEEKNSSSQPPSNSTQTTTTTTTTQPNKESEPPKSVIPESNTNVETFYEVEDEIGRGAFSIVKSAKNKKTGKLWAIKFIEKKLVDKQDLGLLRREIDIMKKLDHPNVLKLQEVFENDEQIALVMELVTGGELFYKIVDKGNYSENDAANIVTQICKGVAYLHSEGIAHRDLKPENLLCSGEEDPAYKPFRVVIADFGLSKTFNSGEKLETSCGTPDYVAPEVITADGGYDKSVDMWSVGVITYVLLCGFSPFLSSTQTGLFEKIIKVEYDFPDPEWTHISQQAKDFIQHLLLKDPEKRFTAQQCLDHPWLNGNAGTESLANGEISNRMKSYNELRKATKKVL